MIQTDKALSFSIVAASGLASHGLGSWKASGKHDVWLHDFLPEDLPKDLPGGIRILSFGYDTDLLHSDNKASISDLAAMFLASLKNARTEARVLLTAYPHSLQMKSLTLC